MRSLLSNIEIFRSPIRARRIHNKSACCSLSRYCKSLNPVCIISCRVCWNDWVFVIICRFVLLLIEERAKERDVIKAFDEEGHDKL